MVTNSGSDKWTFTTIYEPIYGEHPVSGNRDFGFTRNTDGSYTFYTRGVDRLTDRIGETARLINNYPFKKADNLWTSFQNKIKNFVNNHQGKSVVATQEIERPNWQKVKDVLDGKAH
ncbi:hypothetical protein CMU93_00630 [Elizabethkingia anophelis]|nr:hypothetical protein [Elizabethkingia anophelis]